MALSVQEKQERQSERKKIKQTSRITDTCKQPGSVEDCGYVWCRCSIYWRRSIWTSCKGKELFHGRYEEGIRFAHEHDVKVHVTVNILAHNDDLEGVREYLKELKEIKPDALIIADPVYLMLAKEVCPEIERHVSTQANNTNYATYMFWYRQGSSVVSARELSMREIKEIRAHIPDDLEIETFVHGAMCISYSGRCLLSNFFTGRDANHGACTHPCRWKYSVVEETRPGEYMPVYENERGTYIFNSKDLCV